MLTSIFNMLKCDIVTARSFTTFKFNYSTINFIYSKTEKALCHLVLTVAHTVTKKLSLANTFISLSMKFSLNGLKN